MEDQHFERDVSQYLNIPDFVQGAIADFADEVKPAARICRINEDTDENAYVTEKIQQRRTRRVHARTVQGRDNVSEETGSALLACRTRSGPKSKDLGPLLLLDSGASVGLLPFPPAWNGKPPAGGRWREIDLAVGSVWGYLLDGYSYVDPSELPDGKTVDPLIPWGADAMRYHLTADLN